ncbi:Cd2+/Zn2+-exporting ATPase [Parabacteroides sp. PFB2-12]|uniref:heavy metal translocating P-type ATPase n=1 Tax=unclassified Parabacteroides TaxID=2649774 RepID=UPI002475A93B|nr:MULTISPECIES: heavy metal translocating P-type ATPase [unclassified Parabacteroides]MDH6344322.1 Cd2+/Zn2+-exporting ATPase [Parabacteroides sp. PM6-13]MDH6392218.1 Cd2+/Zn2+-exporting ATPase [Parabacteroides sp. PFB2-12]
MATISQDSHRTEQTSACACGHSHSDSNRPAWKKYLPASLSFILLLSGLFFDHLLKPQAFTGSIRLIWYLAAYIPVGFPVIKEAYRALLQKDFFNEFSLMSIATLGAFAIGEFPEGVAVMLFYTVGELFQESAVSKARGNIKALLDVRPDTVTVVRDKQYLTLAPEAVAINEIIQLKAGERVPLDSVMLSPGSSFNTSALTGESVPRTIRKDESVLAGMVNLDKVIELKVTKAYADSSLARILAMVEDATHRKAKTELLIRQFAKIYTPIVFFLALAITFVPALFVNTYVFTDWLYRALVFLVISCPCALVVSIPLSYFGGIGAASRNGILFKGANYLDMMGKLDTVVFDKTGTLTEGVFKVQKLVKQNPSDQLMEAYTAALEAQSNHPIAKAIVQHFPDIELSRYNLEAVEEIPGYGIKGLVDGHEVVVGNGKMMRQYGFRYDESINDIKETVVITAIDACYSGYVVIADQIKEDAVQAVRQLREQGIQQTVMLSGDKSTIVQEAAAKIGIGQSYGDLLPEDKVRHVEQLKGKSTGTLAFVGDGINDAPVLALSDIGIAMGGMGSDAAIEVADVVIQTDQPSKIVTAIKIAQATKAIVVQNIVMALSIKAFVMLLGALGVATMWEAVFADVGVSLLAILNSIRILRKRF